MAQRDQLRKIRKNTIINASSKKMETTLIKALLNVTDKVRKEKKIMLIHEKQILLNDIVSSLRKIYPEIDFQHHFHTSSLRPDGGIIYVLDKNNNKLPVLISEAKRQGTNDKRAQEGLKKQALGNAIERLGKNLIGMRVWLSNEKIFPFVVFGEGIDFAKDSSILDRVSTMAMFAPLNTVELFKVGDKEIFNRGSFYFREETWTQDEIESICYKIIVSSVDYYFNKYGSDTFISEPNN